MMKRLYIVWVALLVLGCGDDEGANNQVDSGPDVDMTSDVGDTDVPDMGEPEFNTPEEAYDFVNPMIGSGGLGFAYGGLTPAAQVPNGMVKVGADTTRNGTHPELTYHFSGYYDNDPHIRGFSHLHLIGTGVSDLGNLRITPNTIQNIADRPPGDWWQTSVKDRELAEPGYYAAFLDESKTFSEMTSSLHGAIHRYTWEGDTAQILTIDPASSVDDKGVIDAFIQRDGTTITGWVEHKGGWVGRSRSFTLHYVIELSAAPESSDTWIDGAYQTDSLQAQGTQTGVVLHYTDLTEPLVVKVAVSMIDADQAQDNFDREVANVAFEDVRDSAKQSWIEKLSRVRIADGDPKHKTVFFTALYNAYRMPTRFDEYGRYMGFDGAVHDVDHPYYTDLSLWDSYRTLHPWYTLYDPEVQRDVLNSLLLMARDGGYVPTWPSGLSYTGGMIGTAADVLFGESAVKGIQGVDFAEAFDALLVSHDTPDGAAFAGRAEYETYLQMGYVPSDVTSESAALTLEYSVHDSGLASLAEHLNRPDVEEYRRRAKFYQNIWDEGSGFMRPRNTDGSWEDPFRPTDFSPRSGGPYTEGTAWHWTLHAPHDPAGLRETMGEAKLLEILETLFESSRDFEGNKALWGVPDIRYWHGNQPDLHNVFYFAEVGRLDLLGHWARQIQTVLYDETSAGLIGNDDGGTLSAWFLFSAVGFYPVVTTTSYLPSPPLFGHVEIELQNGETIRVDTQNHTGAEIESLSIDDVDANGFEHDALSTGAHIEYQLAAPE